MKIKTKLIGMIIISMVFYTTLYVYNTVSLSQKQLSNRIKAIEAEAYKLKKEELINYSDMAIKVIEGYYNKTKKDQVEATTREYITKQSNFLFNIIENFYNTNKDVKSKSELKKDILEIIKGTRYGQNGYFWINDFEARIIMHPINSAINGKVLLNYKDPNGTYVFKEMVETVQRNSKGVVKYYWSKPGEKKPVAKISYVREFKPYGWIIGTGVYIDDITKQMQQEAMDVIKSMRYGKNGYFWINDMENKMVMHPIKPEYDNKYFVNTPKVPFVQLGTQKLKKTNKDKVFIEYSFYTPATKQYSHKLSIVQLFKPWDWVIGTGTYTNYINAKIAQIKKQTKKEMKENIVNIILTSLVTLVAILMVMLYLVNHIIFIPLNQFKEELSKVFKLLTKNPSKIKKLNDTGNDEIALMAKDINQGIEYAIVTHNELLKLRQQLLEQVQQTTTDLHKTKKEFNIVEQIRQEALSYGTLIQNSLIPDEKRIKKIFKNHFIVEKHSKELKSQFHICEAIGEYECLIAIIDTKQDDISGILTSVLINGLVKQYIIEFEHSNNNEFSTSSMLEVLNSKLTEFSQANKTKASQNYGLECGMIYHNKQKNIIKYSGANIPLYYFQNNMINKVDATAVTMGSTSQDSLFEEHIVDIGDYIEVFVSTSNYIQQYIDTDNFVSVFESNTNIFRKNIQKVQQDTFVFGFQINNKPTIFIEYDGIFTQEFINKSMELIEDKIDNIGLVGNLNTNFAEQAQNILHYGKSEDINNNEITPKGYIKLQKNADGIYSLETKNIITLADKEKIEPKLIEISQLDKNGIRQRYRELRKSGKNTHQKGGGIGFYEIAKRCVKVEYEFTKLNPDRYEFRFVSYVGGK